MTPAELRDLRVRAITPTEEEVVVVLDALRRWAVRRTEFGDLSLSFSMSDFPAVYDLIHKAAHGSLSSGSLR
ncbi:MAG: hypothetical protein EBT97_09820, partial [Actinobacteria bacterium]|nr:hypothetical protein [Actinomycetota bacterium]